MSKLSCTCLKIAYKLLILAVQPLLPNIFIPSSNLGPSCFKHGRTPSRRLLPVSYFILRRQQWTSICWLSSPSWSWPTNEMSSCTAGLAGIRIVKQSVSPPPQPRIHHASCVSPPAVTRPPYPPAVFRRDSRSSTSVLCDRETWAFLDNCVKCNRWMAS